MKRITLLAGHYGSGKTNIALNLAYRLKEHHEKVAIADIDIVNPYFRTKDSEQELNENGIKLISSEYASSNVDIPALPAEIYAITDDQSWQAVIDIGGDDRGALALGRYRDKILAENNYEMAFVINRYRPLTPTAKDTLEILKEIEFAGKIPFTAIINNSNLGEETTAQDVLNSVEYANEVSKLTNLPIIYTSVDKRLLEELEGKIDNLLPLKLQDKII